MNSCKELFLYDLKKSKYKAIDIRGYTQADIPIIPLLKDLELEHFNTYDVFHLININKVTEKKDSIEKFLKDEYTLFQSLVTLYTSLLQKFNQELLDKYFHTYNSFQPDCIVIPESSNHWLRAGLADLFSVKLNIPLYVAKKNIPIKFSEINVDNIPTEFKFTFDLDISKFQNVIIIDDCKSNGNTINLIKNEFAKNVNFIEIFYCKY
jgi:adenine/guanine phosphoribosyltransferase-like PRPP-binding protein